MTTERKSQRLELKDIDTKQGIYTGYFSSFGTVDAYQEVVDFGFFAKTFREWGPQGKQRIKCSYQHEPITMLLGKPLKLEEHSFGAYHETKITPTSYGKDVLLLLEDGVLTEQSFMYEVTREVPAHKSADGFRHLVEGICWEYGPQTWGANENTPITSVKAADVIGRMSRLEKHLKAGDLQTPELVAMLTQTMDLWSKNLEQLKAAEPPEREVIDLGTEQKGANEKPLETKSMGGVWSFEETINHVWQVVRMIERIPYSDGDGTYARYYLVETYPDKALIQDDTTGKFYTIPWVRNADGVAVLGGEMTEVVHTWTPAQKAASLAKMLRIAVTASGKAAPETKGGRRHSQGDVDLIKSVHKAAVDLLDEPDRAEAIKTLFGALGEDQLKSVIGSLDESQRAFVLAVISPDPAPGNSHPETENGGNAETPGESAHLAAKARELIDNLSTEMRLKAAVADLKAAVPTAREGK